MPNSYDPVAIKNITGETRSYRYNYSENKEEYVLEPAQVKYYPRFLADHLTEKIVDDYCNDHANLRINDPATRAKIRAMVVVVEKPSEVGKVMTAEEMAIRQAEELNKPVEMPVVDETTQNTEAFAGLQPAVEEKPLKVGELTKDMLISYAKHTLKMDVEAEAFKKLVDGTTPEVLAIALAYEPTI